MLGAREQPGDSQKGGVQWLVVDGEERPAEDPIGQVDVAHRVPVGADKRIKVNEMSQLDQDNGDHEATGHRAHGRLPGVPLLRRYCQRAMPSHCRTWPWRSSANWALGPAAAMRPRLITYTSSLIAMT